MNKLNRPTEPSPNLSPLDQVRELVFGQQMESYDLRFNAQDIKLNEAISEIRHLIEQTSRTLIGELSDRERNLKSNIDRVEAKLNAVEVEANRQFDTMRTHFNESLLFLTNETRRNYISRDEIGLVLKIASEALMKVPSSEN